MKTIPAALLVLALSFIPVAPGFAQETKAPANPWTYGAELDFNSRYVWRSLAWSEGAVWQPSFWIGRSGLVFSVWSNFVLGDEPNRRQFNEIDYRLSWEKEVGDFTIAPAFTIYDYPNQDPVDNPTTGEAEIMIAYALGSFTLETTHFLDVWSNKGGYVGEVGVEFEEETCPCLTLSAAARFLFANAKFNSYYVGYEKGAVNSVVLELGLTWAVAGGLTVRPHFEWNNILDGSLRDAVAVSPWVSSGKSSFLTFGIAIAYER